ncbi:MAG: aminopeptidase [Patescibacteria group bacterium]
MTTSSYHPPKEILNKYAALLVNFALGEPEGIKPGEVIQCVVPDSAKPLALELQTEILKAGGHPLMKIVPTGFEKDFYTHADHDQLTFFPRDYYRSRIKLIDHTISIIADNDPLELKDIPPSKIVASRDSRKPYKDWIIKKELANKLTWTIALWGVQAKADLVGLSYEDYWNQIIQACFLDTEDPISEWRKIKSFQESVRAQLNELKIIELDIQGEDVNLQVRIGADRVWMGGADRNIPSFELFTSPDWRETNGWITFNQPLYRYGNRIEGVRLEFKKGLITSATAREGEAMLQAMIKSKNANKLGEFSLTDSRLSRITHPMAETLYDENIGGPFGNMHLAIGSAYKDCYRGDINSMTTKDWNKRGFNDSAEHTDIVSTTDRTVTATLADGSSKIIYTGGKFTL